MSDVGKSKRGDYVYFINALGGYCICILILILGISLVDPFASNFQGAGFSLTAYTQSITDGKEITSIGA